MTDKDILISELNAISEILDFNGYGRWSEKIRKAVELLKDQKAEKKCCRDCEYYGACHDE